MAKFEGYKSRRGESDSRDRRSGSDRRFGNDTRGGFSRNRNTRELEMTRVTCSGCGDECEVPFRPTTNKPVFCSPCFKNKDNPRSERAPAPDNTSREFELINENLNKIMKHLEIE